MKNKNCKHCGNPLKGKQRKFCCRKCKQNDYYKRNSERFIERAKEWDIKNPEKRKTINKKGMEKFKEDGKLNKAMLKQYHKNKDKWNCRSETRLIFEKLKIEKICKNCGIRLNLEIHHKIYPSTKEAILKAILDDKIYYLCKSCHREITNRKNKTSESFKKKR